MPFFIRVVEEHMHTGTWKLQKTQLVSQGFDLDKTGADRIYYIDHTHKTYSHLTPVEIDSIKKGMLKL